MAYLDKVEELKNILNQLDGYHVDAKRIPSVIIKRKHYIMDQHIQQIQNPFFCVVLNQH